MPEVSRGTDRRKLRSGFRVLHRHRVGNIVVRRSSDLVFANGRPVALLEWINLGGVRTPLYSCELDPTKLRPAPDARNTYVYDEVTVDPRFASADEPDPSAGARK